MCIRSIRALEAHEEVFVDYNYRVWQAPAWYQEQWIQHKRDTENVSEVFKESYDIEYRYRLTLIGMRQGTFHPLSFLDQTLSAEILPKNFKLFWR